MKHSIRSRIILYLLLLTVFLTGCDEETEETIADSQRTIQSEILVIHDENKSYDNSDNRIDDIAEETIVEDQSDNKTVDESTIESGPVVFDPSWEYAEFSEINSGEAMMFRADHSRKNIVVGVNAGHGTKGGMSVKTYSHPDKTPKVTGGTNPKGAIKSMAISGGMTFNDGTREATVTLREAEILRDKLLDKGYDVLLLRDEDDEQLDNIARTVICNNIADCHISLHWDGDGLDYDKGCFYVSTPDALKSMEPVSSTWESSEKLGEALIEGLRSQGCKINGKGSMDIDLTQTSYSTVPSVDIELGNAASAHDDATLGILADGLVSGIDSFFNM